MSTIYIITGQTATGKTNYALDLAAKENGELINCDSRQIYKQLDIITGKDLNLTDRAFHPEKKIGQFDIGYYQTKPTTNNQQQLTTHNSQLTTRIWLYDIIDPKLSFSTFDYNECAIQTIQDILSRNKTPIIVGGTYFYLKQLIYGGITHVVEPNWQLRKELENTSVEELQKLLIHENNQLFETLNNSEKNNPQRLIRWLEITRAPKTDLEQQKKQTVSEIIPGIQIKMIGITPPPKDVLKERIEKRVIKRIQNGAIEEVQKLLTNGYTSLDPGLKTIGYAQILKYLDKTISHNEMINEWINKELQYAKRQLTFMKKDPQIDWIAI